MKKAGSQTNRVSMGASLAYGVLHKNRPLLAVVLDCIVTKGRLLWLEDGCVRSWNTWVAYGVMGAKLSNCIKGTEREERWNNKRGGGGGNKSGGGREEALTG